MLGGAAVGRQTGWNTLPKLTSSLDTLTAAALASNNSNVNGAVNPLAASHFGGTVGQSNLRPGKLGLITLKALSQNVEIPQGATCLGDRLQHIQGFQIQDIP